MSPRNRLVRLSTAMLAAAGLSLGLTAPAGGAEDGLRIDVLSNRADLVSGGDALIDIALPAGVDPDRVRVRLGRSDVSDAFALRENGRFQGLLDGLAEGDNELTARAPGVSGARLTITNHPHGGPVFSGPQIQPWVCQPTAVDEQCNQDPAY
jgi:hypothetical protein